MFRQEFQRDEYLIFKKTYSNVKKKLQFITLNFRKFLFYPLKFINWTHTLNVTYHLD